MKIIRIVLSSYKDGGLKKFFLTMKLTLTLILFMSLQMSASVWSQTTTMSLKLKNSTLQELFTQIEKNSDYRFFYNNDEVDLNESISINVKDKTVGIILATALEGKPYSFKESENKLIVIEKIGNDFVLSGTDAQQQKLVTGKVTDQSGASLPGVSVVVKGTTTGVSSDNSGNFSLTLPANANIIVFSFIGKKTQEVKLDGKSALNVMMVEESIGLDEVVAVGYGTMKRSDLTGSLASISPKDLKNHPMTDFAQVLQGRASGVSVTNTTGAPGKEAKIRIRGANSFSGGNDPLIIIDGLPGNSDINPYDVKSVEILKDASATAIYGNRGANGVILITTLRGDASAPKVVLSTNIGMSQVRKKYDILSPADYATLANQTYGFQQYTPAEIANFRANGGTDWQNEIFRTGLKQDYQASVSGGSEKVRYLFSGNYLNETGTLINTNREKYSFRANIDADFSKRLSVSMNMSANMSDIFNADLGSGGSKENPIIQSILWSPTVPVYQADGTYTVADNVGSLGRNPVYLAKEPYNDAKKRGFGLNTNLKYKILDGLTFDGIASFGSSTDNSKSYSNILLASGNAANTALSNNFGVGETWSVQALLNYNKKFLDWHTVSATAGFEESAGSSRSVGASIRGVDSPGANYAYGTSPSGGQGYGYSSLESFFARVNYNFKSKYFLTATYRADASSKFRDKNKWGYFPSVGLSWNASEEEFIKSLGVFDKLKIRGSWGITGNQAIDSYATFSSLGTEKFAFGSSTSYYGTKPSSPANTQLRWEETMQKDLGFEASFFKSRLNVSMDYYQKETTGLLLKRKLPMYDGEYAVIQNIGQINNKGFDFSADYQIINKRDFVWNAGFNFSILRNKVINLGDDTRLYGDGYGSGIMDGPSAFVIEPGQPLGSFWGVKYLGIWSTAEAAEALKYGNKPGDSKYEDINNDKTINSDDYQIIGKACPDYTWGLNNSFSYKNFELNVLVDAVQGRQVYNIMYASAAVIIPDSKTIKLKEAADIWTTNNQGAQYPAVSTTNKNYISSSRWLQDGSYVKVRNISLTYTFPKRMTKFGDVKLSLSGQNLFTFTKYKGIDPEVSSSGNKDTDQGIDFGVYPTSKIITTGLSITF